MTDDSEGLNVGALVCAAARTGARHVEAAIARGFNKRARFKAMEAMVPMRVLLAQSVHLFTFLVVKHFLFVNTLFYQYIRFDVLHGLYKSPMKSIKSKKTKMLGVRRDGNWQRPYPASEPASALID